MQAKISELAVYPLTTRPVWALTGFSHEKHLSPIYRSRLYLAQADEWISILLPFVTLFLFLPLYYSYFMTYALLVTYALLFTYHWCYTKPLYTHRLLPPCIYFTLLFTYMDFAGHLSVSSYYIPPCPDTLLTVYQQ